MISDRMRPYSLQPISYDLFTHVASF